LSKKTAFLITFVTLFSRVSLYITIIRWYYAQKYPMNLYKTLCLFAQIIFFYQRKNDFLITHLLLIMFVILPIWSRGNQKEK